jgi:hypothetical protein
MQLPWLAYMAQVSICPACNTKLTSATPDMSQSQRWDIFTIAYFDIFHQTYEPIVGPDNNSKLMPLPLPVGPIAPSAGAGNTFFFDAYYIFYKHVPASTFQKHQTAIASVSSDFLQNARQIWQSVQQ